jgi:hypothetical protein
VRPGEELGPKGRLAPGENDRSVTECRGTVNERVDLPARQIRVAWAAPVAEEAGLVAAVADLDERLHPWVARYCATGTISSRRRAVGIG